MSTRSRIGVMDGDGDVCNSIYCHFDGYLTGVGSMLLEHYDSEKANQLVALGNVSILEKNIGEKHEFDTFGLTPAQCDLHELSNKDSCTFYGRDREEYGQGFKVDHTFADFLNRVDESYSEYYYIMKDGVWYVGNPDKGSKLVRLAEALQVETETETETETA